MKKIIFISLLLVSLSLLMGCSKWTEFSDAGEELSDDGALAGQAVGRAGYAKCTDSDGGKNLEVKGTAFGKGARIGSKGIPDFCINDQSVKEFFCSTDTARTPSSIQRNCAQDYIPIGYRCPDGDCTCISGACVSCTDSDGGDNILEKGNIIGPNWLDTPTEIVTGEDYCIVGGEKDGRQVEFYCELDEDGISKVKSRSNECSNDESCKKGVCEANRFCYYLDAAGNRLPAGTRQNDILTDSEGRRYFGIVTEEGTFPPECKNSGVGVGPETVGQVGGYFCGTGTTSFSSGPGVTKSSEVNAIYGCSQGISCRDGACINLCGDGVLDVGESCDDGNTDDSGACPANCVIPQNLCGNSICDPEEETTCSSDCLGLCGNSVCDPNENSETCPGDCVSLCGNGILESGEVCDDGNINHISLPLIGTLLDTCSNNCLAQETDGGVTGSTAGNCIDSVLTYNDVCFNTSHLIEFVYNVSSGLCSDEVGLGSPYYPRRLINCEGSWCINGACYTG